MRLNSPLLAGVHQAAGHGNQLALLRNTRFSKIKHNDRKLSAATATIKIMRTKILFFLTSAISMEVASASPPTLCHRDEEVFFSCSVNKKIVSVCATPENAQSGYMEYRFGTTQKIEMSYRGDATHPRFNRLAVNYASNTATIMWFRNADTDYLLNFPTKGRPSLEIKKEGKTIAEMTCKNGWKEIVGHPEYPSLFISEKPDADYSEAQKYWQP